MVRTAIVALVMAVSLPAVAAEPVEIPRAYWGEYNTNLEQCGTGLNDSRLRVSRKTVRFYESEATLKEIALLPDGDVVLVAEQAGEGSVWASTFIMALSADGSRLTVTHPQTSDIEQVGTTRLRCPK